MDQETRDIHVLESLRLSKFRRQQAIASFPLRVMQIARDLHLLCVTRQHSQQLLSDEEEAAAERMEKVITDTYRKMFGSVMADVERKDETG